MNDQHELGREVVSIAARTSPGIAATAFTWNEIVAILTAIFLLMQIAHLGWKMYRDWKAARSVSL